MDSIRVNRTLNTHIASTSITASMNQMHLSVRSSVSSVCELHKFNAQHNITQHNVMQHNATQRNTTQRKRTQRNAREHKRTQENTRELKRTQENTREHKRIISVSPTDSVQVSSYLVVTCIHWWKFNLLFFKSFFSVRTIHLNYCHWLIVFNHQT